MADARPLDSNEAFARLKPRAEDIYDGLISLRIPYEAVFAIKPEHFSATEADKTLYTTMLKDLKALEGTPSGQRLFAEILMNPFVKRPVEVKPKSAYSGPEASYSTHAQYVPTTHTLLLDSESIIDNPSPSMLAWGHTNLAILVAHEGKHIARRGSGDLRIFMDVPTAACEEQIAVASEGEVANDLGFGTLRHSYFDADLYIKGQLDQLPKPVVEALQAHRKNPHDPASRDAIDKALAGIYGSNFVIMAIYNKGCSAADAAPDQDRDAHMQSLYDEGQRTAEEWITQFRDRAIEAYGKRAAVEPATGSKAPIRLATQEAINTDDPSRDLPRNLPRLAAHNAARTPLA